MYLKHIPSALTAEQASQYLKRIGFITEGIPHPTLAILTRIVHLHLLTFPFENLAMHYSREHTADITPNGLFQRFVEGKRGFGSYCFGQNGLLLQILRAIGYKATSGGASVNTSPPRSLEVDPWSLSHAILFVTPADCPSTDVYLVDVGFGPAGIVRPMLLTENNVVPGSFKPEEYRLVSVTNPQSAWVSESGVEPRPGDPSKAWCLQHRCGRYQPEWRTMYQFSLGIELFQHDYDSLNFAGTMRPTGAPFWGSVIVVSCFEVQGNEGNGVGRQIMFGNTVKRRIGDVEETIRILKTEKERIEALHVLMDIQLTEEEALFIQGRAAEITSGE